jgi:hypothetical protein
MLLYIFCFDMFNIYIPYVQKACHFTIRKYTWFYLIWYADM